MTWLAAGFAFIAAFLAGAAAMAWWLTRWHDDRPSLTTEHRNALDSAWPE